MATLKTISLLRSDLAAGATHNRSEATELHSRLFAGELMASNRISSLIDLYLSFNEDLPSICYALFDGALNKLFTL